jgi:short-subunit dehydrogenase
MQLQGRVALVTGASEGIGAATARLLRARGCRLAGVARSRDKLEAVVGPDGLALAGDLCDPLFRGQVVGQAIDRFGRLDVLVNNAGVGLYAPTWKADPDSLRRMFELNYFAVVDLVRHAVPAMRGQGGGTIVNVSSIGGLVPLPWFTSYSASKYAIMGLTNGLRVELASSNIRCMAVCPGYVKTGFQQNTIAGRPPEKLWRARRYAITPEQCAEALVRGLERDKRTVVVPATGWLLVMAYFLAPGLVDRQLRKIYDTLDFD